MRTCGSRPSLANRFYSPVWIMAYRYREETYRFLINGQTGRATGHAPKSIWKMLLGPAIALAIIGIVLLFGYCL